MANSPATKKNWSKEYLDSKVSVKSVKNLYEAIKQKPNFAMAHREISRITKYRKKYKKSYKK